MVEENPKIKFLITFEIVGRPKEHVEKSIAEYLDNIKKDARIEIIKEDIAEAIELDDGMFSTFCEAEMAVQDLNLLTWLCVNFSPASIEILEPNNINFSASKLTIWYNDLLAKLHEIGTNLRATIQKNKLLSLSMNTVISNFIITVLETGPKKEETIAKLMGINEKQLKPYFQFLIKNDKIVIEDDKYGIKR